MLKGVQAEADCKSRHPEQGLADTSITRPEFKQTTPANLAIIALVSERGTPPNHWLRLDGELGHSMTRT